MLTNAFIGKAKHPTEKELAEELGPSKSLWDQLLKDLKDDHGLAEYEWNSYSAKAGWALRVKSAKRNIVYLSPCRGQFLASFALGGKAMEAVHQTKFPASVRKLVTEARRYAEGTAIRIEVKKTADIEVVSKLVAIKLAN